MSGKTLYDDGEIICDEAGVVIKRYYPWGSKHVPYHSIKNVSRLPIRVRKWRIWGSGDLRHWWNLDPKRPKKNVAHELDTGHWIHPTITPDDVDAVEAIIANARSAEGSTIASSI
jgi:hypothetical protein